MVTLPATGDTIEVAVVVVATRITGVWKLVVEALVEEEEEGWFDVEVSSLLEDDCLELDDIFTVDEELLLEDDCIVLEDIFVVDEALLLLDVVALRAKTLVTVESGVGTETSICRASESSIELAFTVTLSCT